MRIDSKTRDVCILCKNKTESMKVQRKLKALGFRYRDCDEDGKLFYPSQARIGINQNGKMLLNLNASKLFLFKDITFRENYYKQLKTKLDN
jgi:hypothetical protein